MSIFSWEGLLALLLGGLYGSLFGAIPGLTATLAVALFIPIAFFLDPAIALPAIIAISLGCDLCRRRGFCHCTDPWYASQCRVCRGIVCSFSSEIAAI